MRIARATAAGVLIVSMLALGGCKKKKPPVPQPQATAPTITQPQPEAQPPAPAASEPNRPEPETVKPETATAPPPAPTPPPKPKKPRTHSTTAKKTPPPAAPPAPAAEKPAAEKQAPRTVVPDGGTQPATPQLSASLPRDTTIHQKLNTAQLLEATDYNLKSVSRQLSADEQAMVQHIHSYMQQARDATKDGDTERAYNLALKAHLLSDELVKR